MVGEGRLGLGGDEDCGSGGGMGGGRGGDRGEDDGYGRLTKWEDTVTNIILGKEPNVPLAYYTGLEPHQPIMSMLGGHEVQL